MGHLSRLKCLLRQSGIEKKKKKQDVELSERRETSQIKETYTHTRVHFIVV